MDGFDGLQDLLPEAQSRAHGEGPSGLTPPQVGQVTPLQRHGRGRLATMHLQCNHLLSFAMQGYNNTPFIDTDYTIQISS